MKTADSWNANGKECWGVKIPSSKAINQGISLDSTMLLFVVVAEDSVCLENAYHYLKLFFSVFVVVFAKTENDNPAF